MSPENQPRLIAKKSFESIKSELFVIGNQTFEKISPLNIYPIGVKVFFGGFEGDSMTNFRSLALKYSSQGCVSFLAQNPGLRFNHSSRIRRLIPSGFIYDKAIKDKATNIRIPQQQTNFGQWLSAPQEILNIISTEYKNISIDILAHSLGGLWVLNGLKSVRYDNVNNTTLLAPFSYRTEINSEGLASWGQDVIINKELLQILFEEARQNNRYELDVDKSILGLQTATDFVHDKNIECKSDMANVKAIFVNHDEIVCAKAISDLRSSFPDINSQTLSLNSVKGSQLHDMVEYIHGGSV